MFQSSEGISHLKSRCPSPCSPLFAVISCICLVVGVSVSINQDVCTARPVPWTSWLPLFFQHAVHCTIKIHTCSRHLGRKVQRRSMGKGWSEEKGVRRKGRKKLEGSMREKVEKEREKWRRKGEKEGGEGWAWGKLKGNKPTGKSLRWQMLIWVNGLRPACEELGLWEIVCLIVYVKLVCVWCWDMIPWMGNYKQQRLMGLCSQIQAMASFASWSHDLFFKMVPCGYNFVRTLQKE